MPIDPEAVARLIEAVQAILEAREAQILTKVEWRALAAALAGVKATA